MKPFLVLKQEAGEKANETGSVLLDKMGTWMNRYYEKIWLNYNWREAVVIDEAFTLTSGASEQILPKEVMQIISITSRETNAIIQPTSPFVFQEKYLGVIAASAAPIAYVEAGTIGAESNLNADSTITIDSGSSDDVHAVRITGLVNGLLRTEAVQLNGTTAVVGTLTFDQDGLQDISQSQRSAGNVIVYQTTDSGNTLSWISPLDYKNECIKIRLQGPADSARTVYLSYKQRFRPMIYDQDTPKINCEEALVLYAYAQALKLRGKFDQALVEEQSADSLVSSLVSGKDILGADYEETIPKIGVASTDVPYFGGGRF